MEQDRLKFQKLQEDIEAKRKFVQCCYQMSHLEHELLASKNLFDDKFKKALETPYDFTLMIEKQQHEIDVIEADEQEDQLLSQQGEGGEGGEDEMSPITPQQD